ncbi:MAG: YdcF family protein [Pseudohongiellaceae bacterium]
MFNTLFFYLSKILWALLSPANVLFVLLAAGTVLLFCNRIPLAKWMLGTGVILLALAACLPIGKWLATPLETRFATNPEQPDDIDGIIMLGGAADALSSYLWNQTEMGSAAERYLAFAALGKQYPDAQMVFTGGAGTLRDQDFKEADIALYELANLGIARHRLELERESRNTYENAINSKALVNPAPGEHWILVTSAAHMPRSVGVFCQQDWPVIPYPVDHITLPGYQFRLSLELAGNLHDLDVAFKEWVGLLAYRLTGKTKALYPGGCA